MNWRASILAALFVAACSSSGGKTPVPSAVSVGPEGGTVTTPFGVTVEIPRDALDTESRIAVTRTTESVPAGQGPVTPLYRFEPAGLQFRRPVQVTIPLPADVSAASIYWSVANGSGWKPLQTYAAGTSVTGFTTHFSSAFLGAPIGAPGLVWRGPWDTTATYQPNDAVQFGGSSFVAIAESTGTAPPAAQWDLLAAAGQSDGSAAGNSAVHTAHAAGGASGGELSTNVRISGSVNYVAHAKARFVASDTSSYGSCTIGDGARSDTENVLISTVSVHGTERVQYPIRFTFVGSGPATVTLTCRGDASGCIDNNIGGCSSVADVEIVAVEAGPINP